MYINKYKDTSFNDIISRFIPDDILSLDPIVAGGFPLSVHRSLKIYEGNMRSLLMRDIIRRVETFGDIDLWFLNDSDIHNKESHFNNLIKPGLRMGQLAAYKSLSRRTNDSKFASSYMVDATNGEDNIKTTVQIIKEPQESACSLLPKFDYINCAIAWHKGIIYVAKELDDCFDSFELRSNPLYSSKVDESTATMMFRSIRAFKYAKRYSLDFDKDIAKYIFKTYFRIKNIKPGELEQVTSLIGGPYGIMEVTDDIPYSMATSLHKKFIDFVKMKSFRSEYILYLIDSTFLPVKEALACLGLDEFRSTDCNNAIPF